MEATNQPSTLSVTQRAFRERVEAAAEAHRRDRQAPPGVALVVPPGWIDPLEGHLEDAERRPLEAGSDEPVVRGTLGDTNVAVAPARRITDGFTAQEAAFAVRVLATLGTEAFVLLDRAVTLHPDRHRASPLMLVADHLNLLGDNPLVGANEDDWGPRFPDMTAPYDTDWRTAVSASFATPPPLGEGVYAAVQELPGDVEDERYETLRHAGADVAGDGLVPDVIAARHMSRRVLAAVVLAAPGALHEAVPGDDTVRLAREAAQRASVHR